VSCRDLFDQEVERAGRPSVLWSGIDAGNLRIALLKAPEVLLGIVEPVRVIDAQPVDLAGGREGEHETVRCLEHLLVLHAQRGEIVDVEEAPVVDLVRGDAP
jgi:hypothetical protein